VKSELGAPTVLILEKEPLVLTALQAACFTDPAERFASATHRNSTPALIIQKNIY